MWILLSICYPEECAAYERENRRSIIGDFVSLEERVRQAVTSHACDFFTSRGGTAAGPEPSSAHAQPAELRAEMRDRGDLDQEFPPHEVGADMVGSARAGPRKLFKSIEMLASHHAHIL